MGEHPILFSGEMVRAILDGRKTQTRRVVKWRGKPANLHILSVREMGKLGWDFSHARHNGVDSHILRCPYGVPGDRLWVRETWFEEYDVETAKPFEPPRYRYAATETERCVKVDGDGATLLNKDGSEASPWRPSIHMPRWASRLTLAVTGVRVERVQDITAEDCLAEGIVSRGFYPHGLPPATAQLYVEDFAGLWANINGPNSWDANPWVWVIEFERVEAPRG